MSLKHLDKRVVVSVDVNFKNSHQFADGTKIVLERQVNNFNKRETQPVNAVVISAEGIPEGSEVLIGHNSVHDSNRIFDYKPLSGESLAGDIQYYSLPIDDCFAWRDKLGTLHPMKNFQFGLRVFKPYDGVITNIEPEVIKDVLYVTTGDLAGKVCHCLKSSDYEIIFQGQNGREDRVIRFRHSDEEELEREEIIAVNHELTKLVSKGKLLVGLSPTDCEKVSTPTKSGKVCLMTKE